MKYAALTASAAVSALLLLATCVLWVRSYALTDDVFWYGENRMTRYRTSGGGFWFETRPEKLAPTPYTDWQQYPDKALYPFTAAPGSPVHERLGFLVSREGYDLLLVAPYWSAALLFAALPLLWLRSARQRGRRAQLQQPVPGAEASR